MKKENKEKKLNKRKNDKDKKKKRAFTLIELLAVIIILGVVMIIAIPSVTKAISSSRDNSYIATVKQAIGSAKTLVNSGEFNLYDTETSYYIPISCVETENTLKTPYGDFSKAYILVTYNEDGFDYYYTGTDTASVGIKKIVKADDLDKKVIERNVNNDDIHTDVGIDGRSNVIVFNDTCTDMTTGVSNSQYNSSNGTIEETKLVETIEQNIEGEISTGDEIVVGGKEHFYVVSSNGSKTVLISKYNLYVGSIVSFETIDHHSIYTLEKNISESDPDYGWQNSEAIGYKNIMNWNRNVGVVPFSSNRYWLDSNNNVLSKYGGDTSFSIYYDVNVYENTSSTRPDVSCIGSSCRVTNEGYNISYYVNQYASRIRSLGLTVHNARLLTSQEAESLGCDLGSSSPKCTGIDYEFIRNTNFWIAGLYNSNSPRYIYFSNIWFENDPATVNEHGVRPVIEINTSDIPLLDHEYFENKPIIVY